MVLSVLKTIRSAYFRIMTYDLNLCVVHPLGSGAAKTNGFRGLPRVFHD